MRSRLAALAAALGIVVLAGCSDSTAPNQPPNAATEPTPSTSAVDQPQTVTLTWAASDPDGGKLTYDVYLGYADIVHRVAKGLTEASYTPAEPLEYGRTYQWKVVVVDAAGARTDGPMWTFRVVPCPGTTGTICTWAGTGYALWDGGGHSLLESSFYWPMDIEFTPTQGTFIADYNNHRIRHLTAGGALQTVVGTDIIGDGPVDKSDLVFPGAPGTECRLNHPTQVVELVHGPYAGEIIVTSWHNHKIRRWNPATGLIYVVIGRGAGYAGDGKDATDFGRLNQPQETIEASDGTLFILDQRNQVIRKVDTNNIITTVAGIPVASDETGSYNGDNRAPLDTQFNFETGANPQPSGGLAIDDQDNLYVADTMNHIVRKIDWNANTVTIIAGTPSTPGHAGDGGAATSALMSGPMDLAWGPDGRLYVSEKYGHAVRAIDLGTGVIETVVGTGVPGFTGDGGPATQAQVDSPHGIGFDSSGDLYVVDTNNQRIRKVFMP